MTKPVTKIVPVVLPDGVRCANIVFNQLDDGRWHAIMTKQFMIDLQRLLAGEELGLEHVEPWHGDVLKYCE